MSTGCSHLQLSNTIGHDVQRHYKGLWRRLTCCCYCSSKSNEFSAGGSMYTGVIITLLPLSGNRACNFILMLTGVRVGHVSLQ